MADGNEVASAAETVFNTFELVENILLNICDARSRGKDFRINARMTPIRPITDQFEARHFKQIRKGQLRNMMKANSRAYAQELRELFRFQSVNTTFRNVIARSKQLREDMLKETRATPIRTLKSDFWDEEDELVRHINPIAFELEKFLPLRAFEFSFRSYGRDDENKDLEVTVALDGAFEEPSKIASWRSMLLTKAPVSFEVVLSVRTQWLSDTEHETELDEGATLGDFVDAAMKAVKSDMELGSGGMELSSL